MSSFLMQIQPLFFMLMFANQSMANGINSPRRLLADKGKGGMLIYVKYAQEEPVAVDVAADASIADLVHEFADIQGNPRIERLDAFWNDQKKQKTDLLADIGVCAESIIEIKAEEVDMLFEKQDRTERHAWHVTDSKTIRLRVNEDITQSLLNEEITGLPLLGQRRYLSLLDGTRRSRSMDIIIYGQMSNKVLRLEPVEIKLVPLPSGLPSIRLQDLKVGRLFLAESVLSSLGAPSVVIQAQLDHQVAIALNPVYINDVRTTWIAQVPEGFGINIKRRS